ncbi:NAD(P)/FAD-dependent oxidoreductase [Mucilaginibacter lappiensis]|uniref:Glycine/D-amino acid oxidase-like deaminating enzyme n=1 Tax=Mucilaginibacter lappiensis TaxID=354630 RepID=A0A1N7EJG7_9SPHI|nr:FAD-binding oxidoreductase [Mucilaginibacter lappiensis]MBB6111825.1 glycine/D-amino acid oxidase-like deaminating enzyme [Mucilaginibacter lappiensis]MBB6129290.1 glycine/D-amino acid oxidase-like deaminating enzyme [Mucilaginibacter lappiensis]SIR88221.1 Glycine/D-amino acid oxidase [Mucilaginibacter lappiensis]
MEPSFSYWERTAFIDQADVIIIGSGLVGLSAALHLKKQQPNLKVLVLERGFLPSGASTKNAGFACFGTISEQISVINQSSEAEAMRLVDYKWRGLQRLRENLGDAHMDYYQHGGHELFMSHEKDIAQSCIEQIGHLNKLLQQAIGQPDIYAVADAKIADFGFGNVSHVIYNPFEGQLHTGKMMRTLLDKVYSLGVLVLNNCEIIAIDHEDKHIRLTTTQGSFKAGKVILATNAFAGQLYPELNVIPGRGQVLITKPVPGLKLKGTYHFNEGYYYFRNIDNRILFGGGRNLDYKAEETWDFGHTDTVKEKLISYLHKVILPNQDVEIDYWWSGIMGFGEEITPIVKQIQPNVFCAVRCNGMGVAMGSLVGEEVAELTLRE